ncbi:MAG TPA: cytochrome C oxidase subunit IV family protein [Acidobacteriota bacterium]|nr:cytochrome C oxidase subunit IV family protein [Acidobacteriota bacterium]
MSDHITPIRTYVAIFFALLVLTFLTVYVAFFDFGYLNNVIALGIAVFKATLVILWFMHVKHNTRLTWAFASAGFFWLVIFFLLTASDYVSRSWQYQTDGWEPVGAKARVLEAEHEIPAASGEEHGGEDGH